MAALNGAEIIVFDDASRWESWLADHYELPTGVWLKIAKKGSGIASVTLTEALDVALCYGWIDSQRKSYDEAYFLQKYSRRRSRSRWSRVNVDRTEVLVAAGRMREPGLAEILAAQADGRWEAAYESQKNATIPSDLAAALERNEQARAFFETLGRTDQYAVFFRLMTARTPGSRAVRLQEMIARLEAGKKVGPHAPARSGVILPSGTR
ncbi:OmdA domain containing protein [Streptosporangium sp. 'caverna']|nr:OmdA domain containing protein [Streptosporangium sp. 'caverna']